MDSVICLNCGTTSDGQDSLCGVCSAGLFDGVEGYDPHGAGDHTPPAASSVYDALAGPYATSRGGAARRCRSGPRSFPACPAPMASRAGGCAWCCQGRPARRGWRAVGSDVPGSRRARNTTRSARSPGSAARWRAVVAPRLSRPGVARVSLASGVVAAGRESASVRSVHDYFVRSLSGFHPSWPGRGPWQR
jgi:hypothetical protein